MARQLVVIDAQGLLALLTHYTDGEVPMDTEALGVGVHAQLQRHIGIMTRGSWETGREVVVGGQPMGILEPLHFRYEGQKVLSWGEKGAPPEWGERGEVVL